MIYIHNSLRKYIVATLNFFNEVKVQNQNSEGDVVEKNIPVEFSTREKLDNLSNLKESGLLNGNINYLPRAFWLLMILVEMSQGWGIEITKLIFYIKSPQSNISIIQFRIHMICEMFSYYKTQGLSLLDKLK